MPVDHESIQAFTHLLDEWKLKTIIRPLGSTKTGRLFRIMPKGCWICDLEFVEAEGGTFRLKFTPQLWLIRALEEVGIELNTEEATAAPSKASRVPQMLSGQTSN